MTKPAQRWWTRLPWVAWAVLVLVLLARIPAGLRGDVRELQRRVRVLEREHGLVVDSAPGGAVTDGAVPLVPSVPEEPHGR